MSLVPCEVLSSAWPEVLEEEREAQITKCICNSSSVWDIRQLFFFFFPLCKIYL